MISMDDTVRYDVRINTNKFFSSIPTFLFPLFASYKALKTSDPALLTPWLMYWVVLAIALFAESWLGFILVWFADVLFSQITQARWPSNHSFLGYHSIHGCDSVSFSISSFLKLKAQGFSTRHMCIHGFTTMSSLLMIS